MLTVSMKRATKAKTIRWWMMSTTGRCTLAAAGRADHAVDLAHAGAPDVRVAEVPRPADFIYLVFAPERQHRALKGHRGDVGPIVDGSLSTCLVCGVKVAPVVHAKHGPVA